MSQSTTVVAIPARLESKRLPRKLLADVGGKPLLQRVLERCLRPNNQQLLCSAPIARSFVSRSANGPSKTSAGADDTSELQQRQERLAALV